MRADFFCQSASYFHDVSKSLFQKSSCVAANGNFLHSGAHVLIVRSAPVLENHHFRTHMPLFDSGSDCRC
ncbi:hypothetical protein BRY73_16620 [Ochrobactrum sp. P6BS-III]|nr:hypothetical protein BRY73_16620 [Ochrobactrum sp. P6BS-III]